MDIIFINRVTSKINFVMEGTYIYSNLLLSDNALYVSFSAVNLLCYIRVPKFSDEDVIKSFAKMFNEEEDIKDLEDIIRIYPSYKEYQKVKHKDKTTIMLIGHFKTIINSLRSRIQDDYMMLLKSYNLFEALPFIEDKILYVSAIEAKEVDLMEDPYIKLIVGTIIERECVLFLDGSIEDYFNFSTIDASENETVDFKKIPLCELPSFIGITYKEVKYTRDQLQEVLKPFKTHLKDLSDELFKLPFTNESQPQIKQLYNEKLSQFITPIQPAIDESIYLSKQKNIFPDKNAINYCLGITSVETLIDFYEKAEIVEPYVASEIKQQVSRHMDLKATIVFTYCHLKT